MLVIFRESRFQTPKFEFCLFSCRTLYKYKNKRENFPRYNYMDMVDMEKLIYLKPLKILVDKCGSLLEN